VTAGSTCALGVSVLGASSFGCVVSGAAEADAERELPLLVQPREPTAKHAPRRTTGSGSRLWVLGAVLRIRISPQMNRFTGRRELNFAPTGGWKQDRDR
jgi:hypothetical protein